MSESKEIDLLIVDDDDEFRSTTARWFERTGFRASEAGTAEHALEMVDRRHFDVAIVEQWKQEKTYPFQGESASPVEEMERQVFEIVAVTASEHIANFRCRGTQLLISL